VSEFLFPIASFFDYIQPNKLHKRSNDNSFLIVAVEDKKMIGVIEIKEFKHIFIDVCEKDISQTMDYQGIATKGIKYM